MPSLILLVVLAFLLARGAWFMWEKQRESSKLSKNLEEKVLALELREEELKKEVAHLETEEGIKGEIRERFTVTEDGEYVAVIVDAEQDPNSTDGQDLPWYKRFWSAIIGDK